MNNMKSFKRILGVVLAIGFVSGVTGCKNSLNQGQTTNTDSKSSESSTISTELIDIWGHIKSQ